ncbi:hypothetical protein [Rhodococcus maanshanensis]|uniref:VOC family protein n=1 Tax=Rhodococcus maanshanensis TaxID=183556 RepID=A0A1H7Y1D7_9NOCA|nr:hypothetical protein [Rhodococcus maanshanensis]SEM38999.1 hypothetical protein SAMN05444583_13537 [Rhodococcus maanshanensis]
MAGETTVPLLPCRSIDEVAEFYGALGFTQTYRQVRPNPYVALQREDLGLHFSGIPGFNPEDSYGSCLVIVPDIGAMYGSFVEGLRAAFGRVPVSGIPRITRPRKRKNTGELSGFSVIDPGGNWIRIFAAPTGEVTPTPPATGKLARALQSAIVLGDSKGDDGQAARILDATLAREQEKASAADLVEALVYRAELAIRLGDVVGAGALLSLARETVLDESELARLADALANARDLETTLT